MIEMRAQAVCGHDDQTHASHSSFKSHVIDFIDGVSHLNLWHVVDNIPQRIAYLAIADNQNLERVQVSFAFQDTLLLQSIGEGSNIGLVNFQFGCEFRHIHGLGGALNY